MGNVSKIGRVLGKRFGRLTVVGAYCENGRLKCECECSCGNKKVVYAQNLVSGQSKSCGCLRDNVLKTRMTKIPESKYYELMEDRKKGMTYKMLAKKYDVKAWQTIQTIIKKYHTNGEE